MTDSLASSDLRRQSVSLTVPLLSAERVASVLEETEPAPEVVGFFEVTDEQAEIFAHYSETPDLAALQRRLAAALPEVTTFTLRLEAIPDEDWVTLSQGKRGRVLAGRFTIHGSHEPMPARHGVIEIDASRAFGTAHHASTKGCLILLDRILKATRPARVLDIGTGTGVLAIAAAKEGAGRLIATDNDPVAVGIARENARLNRARHIRFFVADGFRHPALSGFRADLVFGNLLQSILFDLAPGFRRAITPGGFAVLSGITDGQAASVEARFRSLGFVLQDRVRLEGWTSLLLRRRGHAKLVLDRAH